MLQQGCVMQYVGITVFTSVARFAGSSQVLWIIHHNTHIKYGGINAIGLEEGLCAQFGAGRRGEHRDIGLLRGEGCGMLVERLVMRVVGMGTGNTAVQCKIIQEPYPVYIVVYMDFLTVSNKI